MLGQANKLLDVFFRESPQTAAVVREFQNLIRWKCQQQERIPKGSVLPFTLEASEYGIQRDLEARPT